MTLEEVAGLEASMRGRGALAPITLQGIDVRTLLALARRALEIEALAAKTEPVEDVFWDAEVECKTAGHPGRICGTCTTSLLAAERDAGAARAVARDALLVALAAEFEDRAKKAADSCEPGCCSSAISEARWMGRSAAWLEAAHKVRAALDATSPAPCPPSSVTGAPCLLPPGHPADSATRFHRYAAEPK